MKKIIVSILLALQFIITSCMLEEVKTIERNELSVLLSNDLLKDTSFLKEIGRKVNLRLKFYKEDSVYKKKVSFDILLSSDIYRSSNQWGGLFTQIDRKILKQVDERFTAKNRKWLGLCYNPHLVMVANSISEDSLKLMDELDLPQWQNAIQFPSKRNPLSLSILYQTALKLGENNAIKVYKTIARGDSLRYYDTLCSAANHLRTKRFTGIYTTQRDYIELKKDTSFTNFKPHFLWQAKGGGFYNLTGIALLNTGNNIQNQEKFVKLLISKKVTYKIANYFDSYSSTIHAQVKVSKLIPYFPAIQEIQPFMWQEQYQKTLRFVKKSSDRHLK
jgi:ABC-type Fe3+ transport system substrate-binding protein